jgi:hypothetical protein
VFQNEIPAKAAGNEKSHYPQRPNFLKKKKKKKKKEKKIRVVRVFQNEIHALQVFDLTTCNYPSR